MFESTRISSILTNDRNRIRQFRFFSNSNTKEVCPEVFSSCSFDIERGLAIPRLTGFRAAIKDWLVYESGIAREAKESLEWNGMSVRRIVGYFCLNQVFEILVQMCENVIVTRSNIESNRRYSKGRGNEVFLQFRSKFSEELRRFLLPCVEEKRGKRKRYISRANSIRNFSILSSILLSVLFVLSLSFRVHPKNRILERQTRRDWEIKRGRKNC